VRGRNNDTSRALSTESNARNNHVSVHDGVRNNSTESLCMWHAQGQLVFTRISVLLATYFELINFNISYHI
jgi:hypothetical protein